MPTSTLTESLMPKTYEEVRAVLVKHLATEEGRSQLPSTFQNYETDESFFIDAQGLGIDCVLTVHYYPERELFCGIDIYDEIHTITGGYDTGWVEIEHIQNDDCTLELDNKQIAHLETIITEIYNGNSSG